MQTQAFSLPRDDRHSLLVRFSLLIGSYVASMVSCTLRLRCGMPTVLFSKTVSRAFRFICWFYYCNKRGTSSTASVWQISYSPAFAFFPHTVPVLWPDLLEELPRVQENIMTERNLMPTKFPLLEEGDRCEVEILIS